MSLRPLLALSFAVLATACAELSDPAVVTVGREKLSLRDLRKEYAELAPAERRGLATRSARLAFVDATVDRKLLADYGRRLADEDPTLLDGVERQLAEILVRRLRTLETGEPAQDPDGQRAALERLAWEYLAERAWFATRESAEAARAAILTGETFPAAAAGARGAATSAPEWMNWTPYPDPVADAVADAPVGAVSEPLADGARWVIVRVLERRPDAGFDRSQVEELVARGLRARRQADSVEAMSARLREDAAFRVSEEGARLLGQRTTDAILDGTAGSLDREWAVPALAPGEADVVVVEWNGGRCTAGEYVEEIRTWIPLQRPQLHLSAEIQLACRRLADHRIQLEEAERRGLEREWWARRALDRLEQQRYVQLAAERIDSASSDLAEADSVAALLHSSQPHLFVREPRVRVLRIEFTDEGAARAERERILRAGGGRELIRDILESRAAGVGTYRVLSLTRAEIGDPVAASRLFDGPLGQLAGPIDLAGLWVLLESWEKVPERKLAAEEILVEVRQRMRRGGDR
ncbi:MAG TPA: peptidylprolyl isomerase, partial [bacterium]|nr:peptidylprolyl isomerase [bacterium]